MSFVRNPVPEGNFRFLASRYFLADTFFFGAVFGAGPKAFKRCSAVLADSVPGYFWTTLFKSERADVLFPKRSSAAACESSASGTRELFGNFATSFFCAEAASLILFCTQYAQPSQYKVSAM